MWVFTRSGRCPVPRGPRMASSATGPDLIGRHRHERMFIAPHARAAAHRRARVDPGEERNRPVTVQQDALFDCQHTGGVQHAAAQPHARPHEGVAPPRFRPEEHMAVDMPAPSRGAAREAPGKRGKQPRVMHELGTHDRNALPRESEACESHRGWRRRRGRRPVRRARPQATDRFRTARDRRRLPR